MSKRNLKLSILKKNYSEQEIILKKITAQNLKLRKEFQELKEKLTNCITKVKTKPQVAEDKTEKTKEELIRERDIKNVSKKIDYYKKQINIIKNQLENSFNINK